MVEEDHFPVGLRVLAVDDDRTYLTVLENLLRKCQYNGLSSFCFNSKFCIGFASHEFLHFFYLLLFSFHVKFWTHETWIPCG